MSALHKHQQQLARLLLDRATITDGGKLLIPLSMFSQPINGVAGDVLLRNCRIGGFIQPGKGSTMPAETPGTAGEPALVLYRNLTEKTAQQHFVAKPDSSNVRLVSADAKLAYKMLCMVINHGEGRADSYHLKDSSFTSNELLQGLEKGWIKAARYLANYGLDVGIIPEEGFYCFDHGLAELELLAGMTPRQVGTHYQGGIPYEKDNAEAALALAADPGGKPASSRPRRKK